MEEWSVSIYGMSLLSDSETDRDNVLQISSVFFNVSKGQLAPAEDLRKAFGSKMTTDEIILEILNKGELQVGEKERNAQLEQIHNEVISIVAGKVVDPESKRVYTTGMIEKALAELSSQAGHHHEHHSKEKPEEGEEDKGKQKELPVWTGFVTTKSSKSQALDAIKALIAHQPIPIARARMKVRVTCPFTLLKQTVKPPTKKDSDENFPKKTIKDSILSLIEEVLDTDTAGDDWEVTGYVEPGSFKLLGELIGEETRGKGRMEVLETAVIHEGDERA